MQAAVTIRGAQAHEREALGLLKLRASLAWGDFVEELRALPEARELPAEHLPFVFVAEVDGRLAGFATVLPGDEGSAELEDLFVEPDLWRRGVARRLVQEAELRARRLGAGVLMVVGNSRAAPFYLAQGFAVIGEVETLFAPAPRMAKDLGPDPQTDAATALI